MGMTVKCPYCNDELDVMSITGPNIRLLRDGNTVDGWHSSCQTFFKVRLVDGEPIAYMDDVAEEEEDDRPQCCKDHGVYGATCDKCDYGDGAEETEDNKLCTYEAVQRNVTVEEVEKLEEELRCARSEVADLKNLIIKLLFDRYGF